MKFSCDRCRMKISFWETFKFKKDYVTKCESCGVSLYPIKVKSFNWSFGIGFCAVIVPAEIVYIITNNLAKTYIVSVGFAFIVVFGVAYYTYKTTDFKSNP